MWQGMNKRQDDAMMKVSWALDEILLSLDLLGIGEDYHRALCSTAPFRNECRISWGSEVWNGTMLGAIDRILSAQPRTKEQLFACLRAQD